MLEAAAARVLASGVQEREGDGEGEVGRHRHGVALPAREEREPAEVEIGGNQHWPPTNRSEAVTT